ncbi:hypothetical protein AGLY_000807 [Aphis glycines]|uniref:Homeobox domain-containing protein n=1 Tax=Aphis glycines TaxID=307491 RepID=A0A6G0U863_APHGL|nr:hypothetical protein AGLY_000807 [Aphis glycines]
MMHILTRRKDAKARRTYYSTIPIFTIGARPIETVNGVSPPPQPTPSGAASLRSSSNAWTLDIATSSLVSLQDTPPSPRHRTLAGPLNLLRSFLPNDFHSNSDTLTVMDMNFGTLLDLDRGQHDDLEPAATAAANSSITVIVPSSNNNSSNSSNSSTSSSSRSTPSSFPPVTDYRHQHRPPAPPTARPPRRRRRRPPPPTRPRRPPRRRGQQHARDPIVLVGRQRIRHHDDRGIQQLLQQRGRRVRSVQRVRANVRSAAAVRRYKRYNTYIRNSAPLLPLLHPQQHMPQQHGSALIGNDEMQITAVSVQRKREKQKRQRTAYSSEQLMHLEESFTANQYLNRARRIDLARTLRLTERQIKIWFQNRRMKEKKSKRDSGQVESTSGGVTAMTPVALAAISGQPPPPPASVPVTVVSSCGGYRRAGHYAADHGCSPPTVNMAMKYSPSSTYSTPSPPGVVQHHHQHHQLAEHQRPGPSGTLHHFSSYAANMYNGAGGMGSCTMPPTYEETVNGQHQSVPLPPQVHLHWYPTSVIASHDSSAADGLQ